MLDVGEDVIKIDAFAFKLCLPGAQQLLSSGNPGEEILDVTGRTFLQLGWEAVRLEDAGLLHQPSLAAEGAVDTTKLTDQGGVGGDPIEAVCNDHLVATGRNDAPAEGEPGGELLKGVELSTHRCHTLIEEEVQRFAQSAMEGKRLWD